jgi:hypothetical protein
MADLNRITRAFLLNEATKPTLASYIQSVTEVLQSITPRSRTDARRIEIASENLREIRRYTKRLQERVSVLEEQVKVLEESKG